MNDRAGGSKPDRVIAPRTAPTATRATPAGTVPPRDSKIPALEPTSLPVSDRGASRARGDPSARRSSRRPDVRPMPRWTRDRGAVAANRPLEAFLALACRSPAPVVWRPVWRSIRAPVLALLSIVCSTRFIPRFLLWGLRPDPSGARFVFPGRKEAPLPDFPSSVGASPLIPSILQSPIYRPVTPITSPCCVASASSSGIQLPVRRPRGTASRRGRGSPSTPPR